MSERFVQCMRCRAVHPEFSDFSYGCPNCESRHLVHRESITQEIQEKAHEIATEILLSRRPKEHYAIYREILESELKRVEKIGGSNGK